MSKENVAKLFRTVQINPELRETLNNAPSIEEFVAMAQEYGYQFTIEEWQEMTRFQVEELESELSEIPGL
ncbi:MAG: Nif11-like leader peptide family natural product precursor [Jaaginema sp. PMC 1079.18]|nr:Nif11-like leader peptide family natural product precursor [Jaaginema sp. PMC 1080.18]MEC4853409.1 Nif11-like leader peptide family natural product precursor [Jaaginema sp. PMC 1079.18]MEC4867610.1 Nif11-like leader peptide family natural product precursor [Jaaginema sp. PMC 1078.18]